MTAKITVSIKNGASTTQQEKSSMSFSDGVNNYADGTSHSTTSGQIAHGHSGSGTKKASCTLNIDETSVGGRWDIKVIYDAHGVTYRTKEFRLNQTHIPFQGTYTAHSPYQRAHDSSPTYLEQIHKLNNRGRIHYRPQWKRHSF